MKKVICVFGLLCFCAALGFCIVTFWDYKALTTQGHTLKDILEVFGVLYNDTERDVVKNVKGQAKYGEFPWVVQILEKISNEDSFDYSYICVGTLVAPNVVLTTVHDVESSRKTDLVVRAGQWDTRKKTEPEPYVDRNVNNIIIHENYNYHFKNFDIAILILNTNFVMSPLISTISLPSAEKNYDHDRCIIAGWGKRRESDAEYSPILKKIDVSVVPRETCQQQLRETLKFRFYELQSSDICANGEGENPCNGDGGAPLMCPVVGSPNRYELAGVLSGTSRQRCNSRDALNFYTNVPMVRSWIIENTNGLQLD